MIESNILYTPGELSRAAGVTHVAVYQAVRIGTLTPTRMTKEGRFLFDEEEARRYINRQIARRLKKK